MWHTLVRDYFEINEDDLRADRWRDVVRQSAIKDIESCIRVWKFDSNEYKEEKDDGKVEEAFWDAYHIDIEWEQDRVGFRTISQSLQSGTKRSVFVVLIKSQYKSIEINNVKREMKRHEDDGFYLRMLVLPDDFYCMEIKLKGNKHFRVSASDFEISKDPPKGISEQKECKIDDGNIEIYVENMEIVCKLVEESND